MKKIKITSRQPNPLPKKAGSLDGKATVVQFPKPSVNPVPSKMEVISELLTGEPEQPNGEAPRRSSSAAQGEEIQRGILTEGQIRSWLEWIDVAALNGETSSQIGLALHHYFDGSRAGRRLWHDFCRRSANYERAACEQEYRGFGSAAQARSTISLAACRA